MQRTGKPIKRIVRLTRLALVLILLPILLVNLSIIVQTAVWPERLPSVLGYKALILMPDSPDGSQPVGIIRTRPLDAIGINDTIAYRKGWTFFIETVHEMDIANGIPTIMTRTGSDNQAALTTVTVDQIEGVLVSRIPRLGSWALFLQSPMGLLLFMILPVFIFLAQDTLFRRKHPARNRPVPDTL